MGWEGTRETFGIHRRVATTRIPEFSAKAHSLGHTPVFSLLVERKKAAERIGENSRERKRKPPNGTLMGIRVGGRPREPLGHTAE